MVKKQKYAERRAAAAQRHFYQMLSLFDYHDAVRPKPDKPEPFMPNRIYLLIALAFIIGGPVVVMGISDMLPADTAADASADGGPAIEMPGSDAEAHPDVEATPPPVVQQAPGSADPLFDANPTLSAEPAGASIPEQTAAHDTPPPAQPARTHVENFSPQSGFGGDDGKPHY